MVFRRIHFVMHTSKNRLLKMMKHTSSHFLPSLNRCVSGNLDDQLFPNHVMSLGRLPSVAALVWLVCRRSVERDNYYSHRATLISWALWWAFIMSHSPLHTTLLEPPGPDRTGRGARPPCCPFTLG